MKKIIDEDLEKIKAKNLALFGSKEINISLILGHLCHILH